MAVSSLLTFVVYNLKNHQTVSAETPMQHLLLSIKKTRTLNANKLYMVSYHSAICAISRTFDVFHRHILASLHLNENLLREPKLTKDGNEYLQVT